MAVATTYEDGPTTEPVISGPIVSADSHITEPPGCYLDNIEPAFHDRVPYLHHDDKAGDLFVIPGMSKAGAHGPRRGGRQGGGGHHGARGVVRRAAPRRRGPRPAGRPGPRRRDGGDRVPHRGHGALQPQGPRLQACVHEMPTTAGSPSTAAPTPTACSASARRAMRTPDEGIALTGGQRPVRK